jgi:hypothetical protein
VHPKPSPADICTGNVDVVPAPATVTATDVIAAMAMMWVIFVRFFCGVDEGMNEG